MHSEVGNSRLGQRVMPERQPHAGWIFGLNYASPAPLTGWESGFQWSMQTGFLSCEEGEYAEKHHCQFVENAKSQIVEIPFK